MFEENGRINTNSEHGHKEVKKGKKVICSECNNEFIIERIEFGEKIICPKCGKSI